MTVIFTEKENQWLSKKLFNWSIKPGCPESIRGPLERKLQELNGFGGRGPGGIG